MRRYADGFAVTAPVEASGVNEWGLYGVGGNVWEWTNEEGVSGHVLRGAAWSSGESPYLLCRYRLSHGGSRGTDSYGFRLVILPGQ